MSSKPCPFCHFQIPWNSVVCGHCTRSLNLDDLADAYAKTFGTGPCDPDPFSFVEGGTSGTAPPEPPYSNFVPPDHWRYQCPVCGARVEMAVDVCWNCGYGE
jgi:CRISPR type IV-associated protein Csf1